MRNFIVGIVLFCVCSLISLNFTNSQSPPVFKGGVTSQVLWTAPATNSDGTPLADLAGYKVGVFDLTQNPEGTNFSPLKTVLVDKNVTAVPAVNILSGLPVGVYRLAVLAFDDYGNESVWSSSVDVDIKVVKPNAPTDVKAQR